MDDEQLGREIRERAYELMGTKRGMVPSDADLGAAARELLAKPVATREGVEAYLTKRDGYVPSMVHVASHLAALTHFAPPRQRVMIEIMGEDALHNAMVQEWGQINETPISHNKTIAACARVAHRLANTPAPEEDADAGAKSAFWTFMQGQGDFLPGTTDSHWHKSTEQERNGWRAVAAMEKGNG